MSALPLSRATVARLVRYSTVSVIATVTSLVVLGVLVNVSSMSAGWANIAATAVGTVPSFELNRRWVWGRTGQRSLGAEVGPFCVLSFAGLALSTLTVSLAASWATHAHLGDVTRTLAIEAANVAAFGTLWVVQYLVLDRILFARRNGVEGSNAVPASRPDPVPVAVPVHSGQR